MNKVRKKLIKHNYEDILKDSDNMEYGNISGYRTVCHSGDIAWQPQVDVFETVKDVVCVFDIPYIDTSCLDIKVSDERLIIKGVRKEYKDFPKRHYYKMEIGFGHFERVINIPVSVDPNKIMTEYKDGFFIIKIKKKAM